jgi:hypothetical protein
MPTVTASHGFQHTRSLRGWGVPGFLGNPLRGQAFAGLAEPVRSAQWHAALATVPLLAET